MSRKTKTTATKEKAKPALVPKLRFPEFRGAGSWTTEALGSVAKISTTKVGDKTCIPMSITSGVGLVSQMDKFGRIIAGSSYANYLQLKKNDFAYNKSATKEYPEGFIALYTGDELAAVPNSIFTCFRVTGSSPVPQYLNYLFLGNLHGRWLRNFIEVGARAHGSLSINQDDLLALPIPLPSGKSSVREQQKIAECLSSVDELIAAQARKVDALKTHKKGLMQQLFPREGETQPRLRFPEFQNAGEWEPTTLGSVARLRNGYAFKSAEYVADGPYQIITIANVQQGNLTLESTKRMAALPPDIQKHQVLEVGDILISMTGNVGRVCLVTAEALLLNQRVGKLVPETIEAAFFYQLLQRDDFRNTMQLKAAGGAQGNLSAGDITEYAFTAPTDPTEQQRIATCLSSLDALITAETQKHEALKTHKKGLMQQLFPSPEEVAA
jgi:type I restriction enzyme, S subunit